MPSAWSMSAIRSSICSIPTDRRIMSGVTPTTRKSSGVSCLWVVEAGWLTSDFASPRFTRRLKSFTALKNLSPAS